MGLFFRKTKSVPVAIGVDEDAHGVREADHMGAIISIYDERKKLDARLKGKKGGNQTPMYYLWNSPDAFIVNAVELLEVLKGDGYTEEEGVRRLLLSNSTAPVAQYDLLSYLRKRLEEIDPDYLLLGREFFQKAIQIARFAAHNEIEKRQKFTLKNPSGEIAGKYDFSAFQSGAYLNEGKRKNFYYSSLPPSDYEGMRDWNRLRLRMKEGDEAWIYLTSYHGFEIQSVALMRQGQVIEYVRADTPRITLRK